VGPTLTPFGSISLLTLSGDNATWSVTIFTASGDQPLKTLRHDAQWTNTRPSLPAPRALARWTADHHGASDERYRGSVSSLRCRRKADRDRLRRDRRCLGMYQSVGRSRADGWISPRAPTARFVARPWRWSARPRRRLRQARIHWNDHARSGDSRANRGRGSDSRRGTGSQERFASPIPGPNWNQLL